MVPIPKEYHPDFWTLEPTDLIELTCLMPNGIVILLKVSYNATLAEIKEDLWDEAAKYPLYGKLHDMSVYVFTCINSMAEREELHDETRRICDVRPTCAVLKIESSGNEPDNTVNVQIGHLIGRRVQEFDSMNNPEINDFRFKMRKLADDIAQERSKYSWLDKLYYQFPPRLCGESKVLEDALNQSKNINIAAKFETNEVGIKSSFTFSVDTKIEPEELLTMILVKKAYFLNIENEKTSDYVLKVCGQDEFLVGKHPIIEFQYIQESLLRDKTPTVVCVQKENVPVLGGKCVNNSDTKKLKSTYSTLTLRKKGKYKSAWDIPDKFSVTLCSITGVNCDIRKTNEIGIQGGIFHGGKSLCQRQRTSIQTVNDQNESCFNETLVFDIDICNIPRNAKLCFFMYEVPKAAKSTRAKRGKEYGNKDSPYIPIVWANTMVYDFKGQLKTGPMTLYMWTFANDIIYEDIFNTLGNVVNNPNTKSATALTVHFNNTVEQQTVLYPSIDTMVEKGFSPNSLTNNSVKDLPNQEIVEHCLKILNDNDNIYEFHEQDRKNIWQLKDYWKRTLPDMLPKLLSSVDWDNKDIVSEVIALLKNWPKLPVEKALELLDYAYPDQEVRSFAVQCLQDVSDEDLMLYLLQLVQAIKHEMYMDSDLVKFLLKRALMNQKIGHYLFWHLRSELQVPSVTVRFGLILEAYCRGSQEHMPILLKQLELLEKLKNSREHVKNKSKEKAKLNLKDYFTEAHIDETIRNIRSPLDPSYRCSKIRLDKCRVMDSKMRPLWIVLENSDHNGEDVYIIFKDGDDLRQDMLTLQMLKIMDSLWKQEGLDLRMNPYNCISLEHRAGMIEVVLNAETIANIQKEKGMFSATSAFRKGSILAWLKDYNTTESALNKAINEFTLSCAGYCVATYVLGIADRHSDNIMVKKSGQLFHIDFGHILGHFKEKFGIKRERVPFVLTHDFVYVINKGQKSTLEFKIFQEYCEKAFLILRKHGNLILSLCAMMISTGLPELSSEKDLNYLRDTLVLSKKEDDALTHFRCKFDEALSNSWKTSLNWASHNLAKNNKA